MGHLFIYRSRLSKTKGRGPFEDFPGAPTAAVVTLLMTTCAP